MKSLCRARCSKCNTERAHGSLCSFPTCGGPIGIDYDHEAISKRVSKRRLSTRQPEVQKYAEFLTVLEPGKVAEI